MKPEMVETLLAEAEKVEIPLPIARILRSQALNLIQGKCVLCERMSEKGICSLCKELPQDRPILRTTRKRLLGRLNPKMVLIRRNCAICREEFHQTVGYALESLRVQGWFKPARNCRPCWRKRNPLPTVKKPKQNSKRKAQAPVINERDLQKLQRKFPSKHGVRQSRT